MDLPLLRRQFQYDRNHNQNRQHDQGVPAQPRPPHGQPHLPRRVARRRRRLRLECHDGDPGRVPHGQSLDDRLNDSGHAQLPAVEVRAAHAPGGAGGQGGRRAGSVKAPSAAAIAAAATAEAANAQRHNSDGVPGEDRQQTERVEVGERRPRPTPSAAPTI